MEPTRRTVGKERAGELIDHQDKDVGVGHVSDRFWFKLRQASRVNDPAGIMTANVAQFPRHASIHARWRI
jgi:hypothetical protein